MGFQAHPGAGRIGLFVVVRLRFLLSRGRGACWLGLGWGEVKGRCPHPRSISQPVGAGSFPVSFLAFPESAKKLLLAKGLKANLGLT